MPRFSEFGVKVSTLRCGLLMVSLIAVSPAFSESENMAPSAAAQIDSEEKPDLAGYAERFLGYAQTDPDFASKRGLVLVRSFIRARDLTTASALARSIRDYRKCGALLEVATSAAAGNDKELVAALESEARGEIQYLSDWRLSQAKLGLAELALAKGESGEAAEILASVPTTEPSRIEAEARFFAHGDNGYREAHLEAFLKRDELSPRIKAEALAGAAESASRAGDPGMATDLAARSIDLAISRAEPGTVSVMGRAIRLVADSGKKQEALKWAEVAAGFAERMSPQNGLKSIELAEIAPVLAETGSPDRAKACVEMAARDLDQVETLFHAIARASVAEGLYMIGDVKAARESVLSALSISLTHPHHRMRAAGAMAAIGMLARTGLELDDELRGAFDKVALSIDKDPHYPASAKPAKP